VTGYRPGPPAHEAIRRYWLDISPWRQQLVVHLGGNEPCCFACQLGFDSWTHTERAHLIAHAHGGPSTPDNLVLLCALCHATMDVLFGHPTCPPELKLTWIAHHPGWYATRLPHWKAAIGQLDERSYQAQVAATQGIDPT